METKTSLRIEKPCHENWNNMLPEEQGKFCMKCAKTVMDFTTKTKDEIVDFFKQRNFETACVRTRNELLDPLQAQLRLKQRLARFAYLLYLAFGSILFSCNTPGSTNTLGIVLAVSEPARDEAQNATTGLMVTRMPEIEQQEFVKGNMFPNHANANEGEIIFLPDTIQLNGVTVNGDYSINDTSMTLGKVVLNTKSISCFTGELQSFTTGLMISRVYEAESGIEMTDSTQVVSVKNNSESQLHLITESPSLLVYPNPNSGEFMIRLKNEKNAKTKLSIVNSAGQLVKELNATDFTDTEIPVTVNMRDLAAGIYFVQMQTGDTLLTERIMLTK